MLYAAALLAAASFGLLAACSRPEARQLNLGSPTIDSLHGQVIRVTNAAPTEWADTNGWRLVEERVIKPAEGSPGEIGSPSGIVADDDGNIYVLQNLPVTIKAYSAKGRWLRDIGRIGEGPGEFRTGRLAILGNTLVMQDLGWSPRRAGRHQRPRCLHS